MKIDEFEATYKSHFAADIEDKRNGALYVFERTQQGCWEHMGAFKDDCAISGEDMPHGRISDALRYLNNLPEDLTIFEKFT